mgnify:CR=1 FL=1
MIVGLDNGHPTRWQAKGALILRPPDRNAPLMLSSGHATVETLAGAPAGASRHATALRWIFPGAAVAGLVIALTGAEPLLLSGPGLAGLLALIVLLGVPHGAMDIVAAWRRGLLATPWRALAFHAAYIGVALLVYLLWHLSPLAGLALFVVCSAAHFRNDWRSGDVQPSAAWIAGIGVVCWPVLFHPTAFTEACAMMGVHNAPPLGSVLWLLGGAALLPALVWVLMAPRAARVWRLELACMMLLAAWTHPLLFFAIYFCFLHGARDLQAQIGRASARLAPSISLGLALLYTLISAAAVIGASALEPAATALTDDGELMRWVFVGLACLTVPHMLMHGSIGRRFDRVFDSRFFGRSPRRPGEKAVEKAVGSGFV